MNVIIQPAGNKGGREHYVDTIARPVPLDIILKHAPSHLRNSIVEAFPGDAAAVWGVTPGSNGVNSNKWKRIVAGDVALFAQDKMIRSSAIVTHKFHSEALAALLWGRDQEDNTWEYVYLLDDLKERSISDELFNQVAGYAPNARRQGFNVLRPELSQRLIDHFELFSDAQIGQATREQYEEALDKEFAPEGTLDRKVTSSSRVEQAYHRNRLLGRKRSGSCALCGQDIPRTLLVAAHIKKRRDCTRDERLDNNVVMLNCKLGCDALYEEGFITVNHGVIMNGKPYPHSPHVAKNVEELLGKPCKAWNESSEPYFRWHREWVSRASK
jgi:hypothetical protein